MPPVNSNGLPIVLSPNRLAIVSPTITSMRSPAATVHPEVVKAVVCDELSVVSTVMLLAVFAFTKIVRPACAPVAIRAKNGLPAAAKLLPLKGVPANVMVSAVSDATGPVKTDGLVSGIEMYLVVTVVVAGKLYVIAPTGTVVTVVV